MPPSGQVSIVEPKYESLHGPTLPQDRWCQARDACHVLANSITGSGQLHMKAGYWSAKTFTNILHRDKERELDSNFTHKETNPKPTPYPKSRKQRGYDIFV